MWRISNESQNKALIFGEIIQSREYLGKSAPIFENRMDE